MAFTRNLSKSRYCVGLQCLRRLWWELHEPDAPELRADARQQAIFDRGHRVGELARAALGEGVLVDFEPYEVKERIAATEEALAAGAARVFEASFGAGGAFAALDGLERRPGPGGGFTLVEVKATLDVKDRHLPDVAIQLHAARAAGVDVRRAELMHLDRACAFPDLSNLFAREDVTDRAVALLPAIPGQLAAMRAAVDGPLPDVATGAQCSDPYDCPFAARCHPALPADHVSTLYRASERRLAAWAAAGVTSLRALPAGERLSAVQARQVRAVRSGRLAVDPGLAAALAAIGRPTAFLDFESVNPPVPAWDGCHPYEHVPVQLSCHVLGPGGGVAHHAHLAEGPGDPRPALAEAVLRACEGARTVVAYNASFEARCLDHLAAAVPARARQLRAVRARLVDLLPAVRDHVYHPDFGGSFSLKAVAPALLSGGGYGDLAVGDGDTASTLLEGLILAPERLAPEERARLREDLLAYCERDTALLVRLHERLHALA